MWTLLSKLSMIHNYDSLQVENFTNKVTVHKPSSEEGIAAE